MQTTSQEPLGTWILMGHYDRYFFSKVEIHSYTPGTVGWGLAATVSTDVNGSISVPVPSTEKGVVYGVKVFATNAAAIVWPNDAAHTVPFHREPGEPGPIINRTYGTDALNFDFDFTDSWATQHYNLAETLRVGYDYATSHRDPNETDVIPPVNVQPTSATISGTFYNPAIDTLTMNSADVFNDDEILHEYAHFLEEQIGSFVWIASIHDGCAARDAFGNLINSPEHAWMEGFANYFAQAVIASVPSGTLVISGTGTIGATRLENQPESCLLPSRFTPDTIEVSVGGILWDLFDAVGTSSAEAHDTISGKDLEIFQIMDHELDTYGIGPTICYFRSAWLARNLDQTALDSILARNGITNCTTPPSANWGEFKKDACRAIGIRQYSAILWNIPTGMSWEAACGATSATIKGQNFSGANRCVNTGTNIWGEFDVSDSSCAPHWGEFGRNACRAIGIRQYSAILWDIPPGMSWENTCSTTPATIKGQNFSGANRCVNTGTNIWGEFDISDSSCSAYWGTFKKDACRSTGVRQYSAILWDIPSGVSWEDTCHATPATIEGQNFTGANRCVNTGFNVWGEFDISDSSCP